MAHLRGGDPKPQTLNPTPLNLNLYPKPYTWECTLALTLCLPSYLSWPLSLSFLVARLVSPSLSPSVFVASASHQLLVGPCATAPLRARRSIRRRFSRGLPKKYSVLLKKLRKAKKECPMHEKPEVVKTHLRNMIIMPEMIGSVVGVYNGKSYVSVEIKAEMVGTYLAEYSMTYRPIKHGRPGIGATASSKFVPLK